MSRNNKRRRIFYVDKIFQKKLLVLFLGINVVIVVSNVIYYMTHLKSAVENNLYRSHIEISNLNEILAGDVLRFNLVLALAALVMVLVFYSLARLRLRSFFQRVIGIVTACRKRKKDEDLRTGIPEEFQEIDQVLENFIKATERELEEEDKRIAQLKSTLAKNR